MFSSNQTKSDAAPNRLVWILAATGLGTGLAMLSIVAWSQERIQADRLKHDVVQADVKKLLTTTGQCLREGMSLTSDLLNESIVSDQAESTFRSETWKARLRELNNGIVANPHHEQVRAGLDLLGNRLASLRELHDRCVEFSRQRRFNQTQLSNARKQCDQTLHELRASWASQEGMHMLQLTTKVRRYRRMKGEEAAQYAGSILEDWAPRLDHGAIKSELADFAMLCERLVAEDQKDNLTNLKDNHFQPSMSRLHRIIHAKSNQDKDGANQKLLREFEVALFGEGFYVDKAHQTILPGNGGLYSACRQRLALDSEKEKLIEQRKIEFEKTRVDRDRLAYNADILTSKLSGKAANSVATAWRTMVIVGSLFATIFLALATKISQAISTQIQSINDKSRALSEENAIVQLLQDVAVSANESSNVEDTLQFVLERICENTGWPIGHAYLWDWEENDMSPSGIFHCDGTICEDKIRTSLESADFKVDGGLLAAVLESREPLWGGHDGSEEDVKFSTMAVHGLHAGFAFPVLVDGKVAAVLEFFSTGIAEPNDRLLKIVADAGAQIGQVIERQQATKHLEVVHSELVEASRAAGKAEVATGVLHNVGNVLNSINVSASLVEECLSRSRLPTLKKTTDLICEQEDLGKFVTEDERGKIIPGYLAKLADSLLTERDQESNEMRSLIEHLDHIKTIVAMQQTYARVSGMLEVVALPRLLEEAELLNASSLEKHAVEVVREMEDLPDMMLDKQKLLQILVNLLKNAKDALTEGRESGRRLVVRIYRQGEDRVRISLTDNGIGISEENLTNIFSHGFTTKETGHGFGLHCCANAAREMGGTLTVTSDGLGSGATFTIELPYAPVEAIA